MTVLSQWLHKADTFPSPYNIVVRSVMVECSQSTERDCFLATSVGVETQFKVYERHHSLSKSILSSEVTRAGV